MNTINDTVSWGVPQSRPDSIHCMSPRFQRHADSSSAGEHSGSPRRDRVYGSSKVPALDFKVPRLRFISRCRSNGATDYWRQTTQSRWNPGTAAAVLLSLEWRQHETGGMTLKGCHRSQFRSAANRGRWLSRCHTCTSSCLALFAAAAFATPLAGSGITPGDVARRLDRSSSS